MKQNKTLRRIFSLLLCLCMVLVYIPVSAFAANIPGGIKLYLAPNSNWIKDNARFAAYFFGTGNTWASMTPVAGETNLYEVTVPTGNWTNVIFCRMNPGNSKNDWNNKWNQTADLTFDGTNNCYAVQAWGDSGTWSAYTPPVPDTPEFAINVEITGEGTVNVSESAHEGDGVLMTAAPEVGHKLVSLTVKFGEEELEVTDNQFTMPAGEVTVSAVFQPAEYWKIYFQNNLNWTKVGVHYWGNGETQWPGEEMTLVEGDNTLSNNGEFEVFVCEIPENVAGFLFTEINEDGSDASAKTADITEGFSDGICYYVQQDGTAGIFDPNAVQYNITVEASENGTVTASETARKGEPVVLTAAPAEGYLLESLTVMFGEEELVVSDNQFTMPAGNVTVTATFREITEDDYATVYFQNNWFWTDVKIHYWGSENFGETTYPGVAMTKVENPVDGYSNGGTYEVYSFDVPTDVDGFLINGTKNDGSGAEDKTPDIEEGFFDGICYYMYWDNANKAGAMISPDVLGVDTPVNTWNISLGDDIGVNFVVDSNVANLLEFCIGETVLAKQVSANGDGTSTVSVGLAAAQMADTITIKGCGAAFEKTYSVLDYAKEILADPELAEDAPLRYLVTEMLNYGAAAQSHFDYNKENLANTGISEVLRNEMDLSAVAQTTFEDSIDGLGYYGASLLFRNKIAVRFYFNGSVKDCAFLEGENTYHLPNQTDDGLYYVEIENITPDALDEQITLTVTRGDGEVITVTYGPMNYIKRMYEKEDTSESLKDVLENLYHYHKAAVAYVESLAAEA